MRQGFSCPITKGRAIEESSTLQEQIHQGADHESSLSTASSHCARIPNSLVVCPAVSPRLRNNCRNRNGSKRRGCGRCQNAGHPPNHLPIPRNSVPTPVPITAALPT